MKQSFIYMLFEAFSQVCIQNNDILLYTWKSKLVILFILWRYPIYFRYTMHLTESLWLQSLHFNEIQMKTLLIDHIFWYAYMNWLGPRQSNFLWLPIRLHMYTHLLIRLPQLFLNCSNNLFFSRNKLPTFLN